jgi:signal transduction histidine kinase
LIDFSETKKKIQIRFQDNGIGLERIELKKIFRKFYQVGNSDDMSARGSGLGLYMAQNIARIHKGKLIADSQGPGKGTTFILMLPRNRMVQ